MSAQTVWFDEPLPAARRPKPVCPKCGATKPPARPFVVVEYFSTIIGRMVGGQQYGSEAIAKAALRQLGGKPETQRFRVTAHMMACQNLWCRHEDEAEAFLVRREPAVKLSLMNGPDKCPF